MEEIFTDFGAFWKTIINNPAVKSVNCVTKIMRAFGSSGCRERIVGFVGAYREQARLEAPRGHDS